MLTEEAKTVIEQETDAMVERHKKEISARSKAWRAAAELPPKEASAIVVAIALTGGFLSKKGLDLLYRILNETIDIREDLLRRLDKKEDEK